MWVAKCPVCDKENYIWNASEFDRHFQTGESSVAAAVVWHCMLDHGSKGYGKESFLECPLCNFSHDVIGLTNDANIQAAADHYHKHHTYEELANIMVLNQLGRVYGPKQ